MKDPSCKYFVITIEVLIWSCVGPDKNAGKIQLWFFSTGTVILGFGSSKML